MRILYNTTESTPYNFRRIGAEWIEDREDGAVWAMSTTAYTRFCEETAGTGHTHTLAKINIAIGKT
jgi:hypothetical protein